MFGFLSTLILYVSCASQYFVFIGIIIHIVHNPLKNTHLKSTVQLKHYV